MFFYFVKLLDVAIIIVKTKKYEVKCVEGLIACGERRVRFEYSIGMAKCQLHFW